MDRNAWIGLSSLMTGIPQSGSMSALQAFDLDITLPSLYSPDTLILWVRSQKTTNVKSKSIKETT